MVDLHRFRAAAYLDEAYDYAFQTGQYWMFGDATAQDVSELVRGANPQASNGDGSPLADPGGLCRRAADTAFGRWKLCKGHSLSVRELALLGSMKEAAVRNSLSKERIAIKQGEIDCEIALDWLQRRRDFVPTRMEEAHEERWIAHARAVLDHRDFADAFAEIMRNYPMTVEALAAKAAVPPQFVEALMAGQPSPDLEGLRQVGQALDLDAPHFAGAAVQAALRTPDSSRTRAASARMRTRAVALNQPFELAGMESPARRRP